MASSAMDNDTLCISAEALLVDQDDLSDELECVQSLGPRLLLSTPPKTSLQSPSWRALLDPRRSVPETSVKSSAFNLISTTIGGGCLSLPYAFQEAGVLLSSVILIIIALMAVHSLELLVSCSRRSTQKDPSYADIAEEALGIWGRRLGRAMIITIPYFAVVAYLILLGNLLPQFFGNFTGREINNVWYTSRTVLMCLISAFVYPATLMPTMGSLRYTSLISLVSVIFLAFCMALYYFNDTINVSSEPIVWAHPDFRFFFSFSLISVSFCSHFNLLPMHYELRRPTRKRVSRVIRLSVGIATIVYFVISVMGYLSFRGHVPDDILLAYGNSPLLVVGRAGMIVTLCCGVPLLVLPCRDMLHDALFPRKEKSLTRIFMISLVLIGSALLMAVSIPNIAVVWDFLGATTSTMACFVCPAVFYLRLRRKSVFHDQKSVKALLLLVMGAVMCVLCTIDSIMNVTNRKM